MNKTFKNKKDAKQFYELKMNEYKVYNLVSLNELVALMPALSKWIEFTNSYPELALLENLETVVVNEIQRLEEHNRSQELGLVVDGYLDEKILAYHRKTNQNSSVGDHCRNIRSQLIKLKEFFGECINISEITFGDAKLFLGALHEDYELTAQSVINHRSTVISLFNHALKEDYISKNVFKNTEKPEFEDKAILYYSLEDMENIWFRACPEIRLAVLLQAFCGVRACEYKRLLWSDLQPENKVISIRGAVGKKGKKRIIFLDDIQTEQLSLLKGLLCPIKDDDEVGLGIIDTIEPDFDIEDSKGLEDFVGYLNQETKSSKIFAMGAREYKEKLDAVFPDRIHNGFRHSFGTYHYAMYKDWMKTTEQMGNSAAVLKKHYNGCTNPKLAENYFSIIKIREELEVDSSYTHEYTEFVGDEVHDIIQKHQLEAHPSNHRIHKDL